MDELIARAPDDELLSALAQAMPRIQRIALVLTNNRDEADELVADALARMLPRWRDRKIADPPAYLKRTVVNLASRRWRRLALAHARDHRAIEWTRNAPEAADLVVERDATLRAIRALPPRRRTVVVLRYYDDLSLEQISNLLDINLGTVKSQLSRALEQLRTTLEDQNQR